MPSPKRIQPGETIDLKLGVSERLTIQQLTMVEPELAERVAKAPKEQKKIPFTLDELDDLIGHVAADLNHTKDENKRYWLEKLYEKIDYLLHRYTDEPESPKQPARSRTVASRRAKNSPSSISMVFGLASTSAPMDGGTTRSKP